MTCFIICLLDNMLKYFTLAYLSICVLSFDRLFLFAMITNTIGVSRYGNPRVMMMQRCVNKAENYSWPYQNKDDISR